MRSKCQTNNGALKIILVDLKFSHEKRCDLPFTLFFLLLALKALHKSQHVKRFVEVFFSQLANFPDGRGEGQLNSGNVPLTCKLMICEKFSFLA